VNEDRQRSVPLLYQFAVDAGQIPPSAASATPAIDITTAQESVFYKPSYTINWQEVARAGEAYIDRQCNTFLTALDTLEKSRRTTLANLNSVQSATIGMMGLLKTAQQAIGITGVAFGLAASLFDLTTSTVLYQLPATSVMAIVEAQRQYFRNQETAEHASLEWHNITNRAAASARLYNYVQYCAPLTIEANITKVLNRIGIDTDGNLVVGPTLPAASGPSPVFVQEGTGAPPAPRPSGALPVHEEASSLGPKKPPPPPVTKCRPPEVPNVLKRKQDVKTFVFNLAIKAKRDAVSLGTLNSIFSAVGVTTASTAPVVKGNAIINFVQDNVCTVTQMDKLSKDLSGVRTQPF